MKLSKQVIQAEIDRYENGIKANDTQIAEIKKDEKPNKTKIKMFENVTREYKIIITELKKDLAKL